MAMTKAERARVEALEIELAFRWPMEAEPKPMTREDIEVAKVELIPRDRSVIRLRRAATGWGFNAHSLEIWPMWSDGVCHGIRNHTGDGASQWMGTMYRTKREAALALRWAMCRQYAKALHAVDATLSVEVVR